MARKRKTKKSQLESIIKKAMAISPLDIEKASAEEARLDKEIQKLSEELKEEDPIDPDTWTEAELRAELARLEEQCPTPTEAEQRAALAKEEYESLIEPELLAFLAELDKQFPIHWSYVQAKRSLGCGRY